MQTVLTRKILLVTIILMKKVLSTLIFSIALLFTFNTPALAVKKVNPIYAPQAITLVNYNQTNLRTTFLLVKKATNISYTLVYEANGIPQGVSGNITPNGKNTIVKNITLGTCSSNTCVNHKKIKKMKLEVTYEFPGKTITKTYSVRTN